MCKVDWACKMIKKETEVQKQVQAIQSFLNKYHQPYNDVLHVLDTLDKVGFEGWWLLSFIFAWMLQILRSAACDAAVLAGDGCMGDGIIIQMSSSTSLKDTLLFSFNSKSDCLLGCWRYKLVAKMTYIYDSSKFFSGQSYLIWSQNESNSLQL